jgi:putative ABC transport system substrate-binding protein
MQSDQLNRREFVTLLGGAAALLGSRSPLGAQQANKIYRLGLLSPASAAIDSIRAVTVPELAKAGFVEGQNLVLDVRIGVGSQLSELARALVVGNMDAIVAVSDISIEAVKTASSTIPVVMSFGTGDPVAAGFAASITRPGGNITGVVMLAPELNAKRLTLLHEAIPKARRIAALTVSEHRYETILQAMRIVAAGAGFELPTFSAETPGSYPSAFTTMRSAGVEALIIVSAPEFNRDAEILAALAVEAKLPTVCEWSHMAAQGCLFGYGPSQTELRRRTADYLVRIFRGSAPADLPIEGPTRFQFAVNLKTAKRLGIELPTGLLLRADEVIE